VDNIASDSFKHTLTALILFSLFAFLMVFAIQQMGENYGKDTREIGGGSLNDSEFQASIDDVEDKAENYRARFDESGNVDDVDDVTGIFSIVTDMVSLITAPFGLLATVFTDILGVPLLVTSIILGILGISLILGIWRLLRAGD